MPSDSLFAALGAAPNVILNVLLPLLYFLASICVYLLLILQISARTSTSVDEPKRRFGLPEAILAAALIFLLLLNVSASVSNRPVQLNGRNLLNSLGGFFKITFLRALSTGIILILAAYPLISLADAITRRLFGNGSSKQSIVELFSGSRTIEQRIMIVVFAVAIAPVVEEFLFRFFLYGVLKRYFGRFLGITVNALLFAAAHTHFPSFAPLFILGSCFTIAYEWSGSILVAMTMHSLFNSVSLTVLAFPELFPQ